MIRFALVPVVTVGASRGPAYFAWRDGPAPLFPGVRWEARDYGDEPSMLIASNMSDVDWTTLGAQAGVTRFADDLDTPVGAAALAAMQASLDALNLPGNMVTATTTHRQIVRAVLGVFALLQCMQGKGYRVFNTGITLATTMGALPVMARRALSDCADTLGYDQTGITLASTVRQVLVKIAQQASPTPMLGVSL